MQYSNQELIDYCKSHISGYGIDSAIATKFLQMADEISALNEKIAVLEAHWD